MSKQMKLLKSSATICLLCSMVNIPIVCADSAVGRFEKELPKCSIRNSNGEIKPCRKDERVAIGYTIRFIGPEALLMEAIIFFKYKNLVFLRLTKANTYEVMKTASETGIWEGIKNGIKNTFSLDRKHDSASNMTRGSWPIQVYAPSDDKRQATLIAGVPVDFTWCATDYKRFVIKKDGRELFAADTAEKRSVTVPAGVFKEAGRYEFEAGNGSTPPDKNFVVVKDQEATKLLLENLEKISKEAASPEEAIINKAHYLQALTDLIPEKWQLDWYACQLLAELKVELQKELKKKPEGVTCRLTELEQICLP